MRSHFYQIHSLLNFSTEYVNWKQNDVTPSNLLNLLVLVEHEFQKHLTIFYFLSDLSGLKIKVLQANN